MRLFKSEMVHDAMTTPSRATRGFARRYGYRQDRVQDALSRPGLLPAASLQRVTDAMLAANRSLSRRDRAA